MTEEIASLFARTPSITGEQLPLSATHGLKLTSRRDRLRDGVKLSPVATGLYQ